MHLFACFRLSLLLIFKADCFWHSSWRVHITPNVASLSGNLAQTTLSFLIQHQTTLSYILFALQTYIFWTETASSIPMSMLPAEDCKMWLVTCLWWVSSFHKWDLVLKFETKLLFHLYFSFKLVRNIPFDIIQFHWTAFTRNCAFSQNFKTILLQIYCENQSNFLDLIMKRIFIHKKN